MAVITIHTYVGVESHRATGVQRSPESILHNFTDLTPPPASPKDVVSYCFSATLGRNEPVTIEPQVGSSAWLGRSFGDDFYNRIHIIPSTIDVGNLVSEQQFTIEVWNGYFIPKNLNNILEINTGGIDLVGTVPPSTWAALETRSYLLVVKTDGPPEIDATFHFDWDGTIDDGDLKVIGSRIVGLAYPFEVPVTEVLEWKTNLLKSNDGTEQRVRLRKKPRQGMSLRYPIPYTEMINAENLAYGWVDKRWAVALWTEAQQIAVATGGETVISIDTTAVDFRVGALVLIWEHNRLSTTATIASITDTTLTFDKPLPATFTGPWVMPVRLGRVLGDISRETNAHNALIRMNLEFSDNVDLAPPAPPDQFLGMDVYFDEVLKGGDSLTDRINRRVDVIDYSTAKAAQVFSPWLYTQVVRPIGYLVQGLDDIWTFRNWLHRREGRVRPFWLPTFEKNLNLIQTGTLLGSINVTSDNYREFAPDRTHLAFKLTDGTWLIRTVVAITPSSETEAVVGLDSDLNIDASTIEFISFLGLKRLDTDRVELEWLGNRTVRSTIRIVEIQP